MPGGVWSSTRRLNALEAKIAGLAAEIQDRQDITIGSRVWRGVQFRTGRRDWHHRAVQQGRKSGFVPGHVHVGQPFGEIPRDQGTQASEHASQSRDDDRGGSASKRVAESQRYYEKKRAEGKKHNQAIRAFGRHLTRIIYKLLKEEREYEIRPEKGNTKTKVGPTACVKTQIRRPKISGIEKN